MKTLGEVARAAFFNATGPTTTEDWEKAAAAVVAEYEWRKAASEQPTAEEVSLWRSGEPFMAIKLYRQRTKSTLKQAYDALRTAACPAPQAIPPSPDYRALLVEAANEIHALAKEGLTIDAELKHDLLTFAARIRAALEGK